MTATGDRPERRCARLYGRYCARVDLGGRNPVVDVSDLVNDALASSEADQAYRTVLQFSNDLASASPPQLQGLVVEPPKPLPAGWDSCIGVVVEWHGLQAGIEPPRWVLGTVDPGAPP